jgi:hypothetical protein
MRAGKTKQERLIRSVELRQEEIARAFRKLLCAIVRLLMLFRDLPDGQSIVLSGEMLDELGRLRQVLDRLAPTPGLFEDPMLISAWPPPNTASEAANREQAHRLQAQAIEAVHQAVIAVAKLGETLDQVPKWTPVPCSLQHRELRDVQRALDCFDRTLARSKETPRTQPDGLCSQRSIATFESERHTP